MYKKIRCRKIPTQIDGSLLTGLPPRLVPLQIDLAEMAGTHSLYGFHLAREIHLIEF